MHLFLFRCIFGFDSHGFFRTCPAREERTHNVRSHDFIRRRVLERSHGEKEMIRGSNSSHPPTCLVMVEVFIDKTQSKQ